METTRAHMGIGFISFVCIFLTGCNPEPPMILAQTPRMTLGTEIDDSVVTARINSALLADASMKRHDVSVVTRKGEVMMRGSVASQAQMDRAVRIATAMEGVQSVSNSLQIKP